ncbi:unnamed protein product [Caenorhabditis brenneri]
MMQDEDQETLKLEYLKLVPCPTELYFNNCSSAVHREPTIWNTGIALATLLVPGQIIFFIGHSLIYVRKSENINTFSKRTKKLQKAFFRAGIAQVSSPISVLIVPLILLSYILITKQYLPGLINICVLIIPANSAFSTISLLIFNAAYRNFIKGLLKVIPIAENSTNRVAVASSII